jgi:hypothetical protein
LTPEAQALVSESALPKFGCNNTYRVTDTLTALLACNPEWWDYYWPREPELRNGTFEKWTWDSPTAKRYGLSYIRGEWGDGLSRDDGVIYYGHSSGYQLLGLAYHYVKHEPSELILIGYDLRYPKGYSGFEQKVGDGQRHYFGEYPKELQHWTKFKMGTDGQLNGLLECYQTINPDDYNLRIINCSAGSALDFFETGDLADYV